MATVKSGLDGKKRPTRIRGPKSIQYLFFVLEILNDIGPTRHMLTAALRQEADRPKLPRYLSPQT